MPELRQDPTSGDWVIIAPERATRPHELRRPEARRPLPAYDPACPFCPGQEAQTPSEILAYRESGSANAPGWTVRVFPNRFPALTPAVPAEPRLEGDLLRGMDGAGYHEVIVETPIHNRPMAAMDPHEVEKVLLAYRERHLAIEQDQRVRWIGLFKNHGEAAGTSLLHPHSQLIATPVVPAYVQRRYELAGRHSETTGRSLYADLIEAERRDGQRIVLETRGFVAFNPFASQGPFETWIVPTREGASFGEIRSDEIAELGGLLRDVLGRLAKALGDPDYNYLFHTGPAGAGPGGYRWHLQIFPRLNTLGGLEIGSGMRINTTRPEDAAHLLREASSGA